MITYKSNFFQIILELVLYVLEMLVLNRNKVEPFIFKFNVYVIESMDKFAEIEINY